MKSFIAMVLAVILLSYTVVSAPSPGQQLGQFGLATLGSLAGAVVAVTAIAEFGPQLESGFGSTALVIGSLTVFDGLGAAVGVMAAGKIWDLEGSIGGSMLGGMAGGFVSAFVEPLLYMVGIPVEKRVWPRLCFLTSQQPVACRA